MKKRIVAVAPGRGSYTADTMRYFQRHHGRFDEFLNLWNELRIKSGEPSLSDLDSREKFSPSIHTKGEHASTLIAACSLMDFWALPEDVEVVAVLGNSMGWYITLAMAGCVDPKNAFHLIQTMGSMMKSEIVGGQVLYQVAADDWTKSSERERVLFSALDEVKRLGIGEAYVSIYLGGNIVIGGTKPALDYLLKFLPKVGETPFQLINHAAFHTPLLYETSKKAFDLIPEFHFERPKVPMVDGQGKIWTPYSTNIADLYQYTLGQQVYAPYDFTLSLQVAMKEFAPDAFWLLGPGASLGAPIGQAIVKNRWKGVATKDEFKSKSSELLRLSFQK
jgi:[acyl-carrier-protein] S-malonyltransferase